MLTSAAEIFNDTAAPILDSELLKWRARARTLSRCFLCAT